MGKHRRVMTSGVSFDRNGSLKRFPFYINIHVYASASRKTELEEALAKRVHLNISVDESKRPDSAKNLMKVYKDAPENLMGTSGTFVKLNTDEI